jgi:uncharacterized protein with PQ loop repeat
MRQRRGRGREPRDNDVTNEFVFLDEDDQNRLVQEIQTKVNEQQARIVKLFQWLCRVTAVLTILFVWLSVASASDAESLSDNKYNKYDEHKRAQTWQWLHGLASAGLHLQQATQCTVQSFRAVSFMMMIVANVALASFAVWNARTEQADSFVFAHQGLVLSNLVTILGAWVVRWDEKDTIWQLTELKQAKYRYKDL